MPDESQISKFEMQLDRKLHAMELYYQHEDKPDYQEIIVNSKPRIEVTYSGNYNDTTTYLILEFSMQKEHFKKIIHDKTKFEKNLTIDINNHCFSNISDEIVEKVALELENDDGNDWRLQSGQKQNIEIKDNTIIKRIWGDDYRFRFFLSHKSDVKAETHRLKENLEKWGVSCFVAHDDIEPSREWAKEIDYALRSMQIFVALNTEKYFESAWTNQEIGYALGRGIEVLCFKMCAEAPKGFIGQFQAEKATWDNVYNKIISYLRKKGEWKEIITKSLKVCESFQWSKVIWVQLNKLDNLNQVHVNNIIEGFNNNPNCYNSWFLNGTNNPGLSDLINRLSGSKYEIVKVDSKYQLVVNNAEDVEQDEGNEEVPF